MDSEEYVDLDNPYDIRVFEQLYLHKPDNVNPLEISDILFSDSILIRNNENNVLWVSFKSNTPEKMAQIVYKLSKKETILYLIQFFVSQFDDNDKARFAAEYYNLRNKDENVPVVPATSVLVGHTDTK